VKFLLFMCLFLIGIKSSANQCQDFLLSKDKSTFMKKVLSLRQQDRFVLETLAFMHLGADDLDQFFNRGFLDFEFYYTPNISPKGSPDRHYKLMMHYEYYTQTIIYNSAKFKVVEASTREGW